MNHSPHQPLRLLFDVDRHIETAFEELIHTPWGRDLGASIWQPALDIYELNDCYLIEADLPGVLPERVEVAAEGRRLTLSGTRDTVMTALSQTGRSLLLERRQGHFRRTMEFEQEVDTQHIETQFDQGTLRIRVPKKGVRPA
jgi:HSP20 family protein